MTVHIPIAGVECGGCALASYRENRPDTSRSGEQSRCRPAHRTSSCRQGQGLVESRRRSTWPRGDERSIRVSNVPGASLNSLRMFFDEVLNMWANPVATWQERPWPQRADCLEKYIHMSGSVFPFFGKIPEISREVVSGLGIALWGCSSACSHAFLFRLSRMQCWES